MNIMNIITILAFVALVVMNLSLLCVAIIAIFTHSLKSFNYVSKVFFAATVVFAISALILV